MAPACAATAALRVWLRGSLTRLCSAASRALPEGRESAHGQPSRATSGRREICADKSSWAMGNLRRGAAHDGRRGRMRARGATRRAHVPHVHPRPRCAQFRAPALRGRARISPPRPSREGGRHQNAATGASTRGRTGVRTRRRRRTAAPRGSSRACAPRLPRQQSAHRAALRALSARRRTASLLEAPQTGRRAGARSRRGCAPVPECSRCGSVLRVHRWLGSISEHTWSPCAGHRHGTGLVPYMPAQSTETWSAILSSVALCRTRATRALCLTTSQRTDARAPEGNGARQHLDGTCLPI